MEWVPKTLVFAKDDDHCDRIVEVMREVFNEGNAFCKKITYKVGKKTAEESIKAFRTDPQFRIAVTVDMIATGTDIRPLECVLFMRDVKSQAYYEQMKGRGTRIIGIDQLRKVTPDAPGKTRFVLVDCVGVVETDKTESKSLETKPSVATAKLMEQVARGDRHSDTLRALGNRMIRLDLKLDAQQRKQISQLTGQPLALIAGELIHATNSDQLIEQAQATTGKDQPSEQAIQAAFKDSANQLVKPFHNPELRDLLEQLRRDTDQIIDESPDELIEEGTGFDAEKAQGIITRYEAFIQQHKNELDAIQLVYSQPYKNRHLSYQQLNELVEQIEQPPYNIAPAAVWNAYEQLEKLKTKGAAPSEKLPALISLIRCSIGVANQLEPFPQIVEQRFEAWLNQLQQTGTTAFSPEQATWLERIKQQIMYNAEFEMDDFDFIPECKQQGGLLKAQALFGKELPEIVRELNGYLIA